jgi:hypothetical protein
VRSGSQPPAAKETQIIGLGKFSSSVADLGSNKKRKLFTG